MNDKQWSRMGPLGNEWQNPRSAGRIKDDVSGIGVWLAWLIGGVCGVIVLLLIIRYCCLMPRNQKPNVDPCGKRECASKDSNNWNMYQSPSGLQGTRGIRPVSYAGHISHSNMVPSRSEIYNNHHHHHHQKSQERIISHGYINNTPTISEFTTQYASSSMLDDMNSAGSVDSLKTRSLPAFLRSKQRPLSTEDDLYQLYAKVNFSKKRKNRMRNDDAAIIALSKSRSQCLNADAVIVYDERTAL